MTFSDLNSDCEACRLREERMGEECIAREEAAKEAGLPYECECGRLKCTHTKEEQEGLTVTLRFKSPVARKYFLGQLSDGWGENEVQLEWPEEIDLYEARVVDVRVFSTHTDEEVITEADARARRQRSGPTKGFID